MQAILPDVSWALTAVLLVLAVWMGVRERTPFYALLVLGALVGAFAEPLYDVAMMLYFYSTPGMWTHFTAFDIPQPIWTHSGYVVLYAAPAIYITRQIARDTMTRQTLFFWAGITLLESAAFEMIGINGGLYTYWGRHVFRIFQYPLVIGVLEAAQVICFAIAASVLRDRHTSLWQLLGLFALFPCTFFMANFGAGWPTIIAMHLRHTSTLAVTAATVVSIGFAVVLVRAAASFLPVPHNARSASSRRGQRSGAVMRQSPVTPIQPKELANVHIHQYSPRLVHPCRCCGAGADLATRFPVDGGRWQHPQPDRVLWRCDGSRWNRRIPEHRHGHRLARIHGVGCLRQQEDWAGVQMGMDLCGIVLCWCIDGLPGVSRYSGEVSRQARSHRRIKRLPSLTPNAVIYPV